MIESKIDALLEEVDDLEDEDDAARMVSEAFVEVVQKRNDMLDSSLNNIAEQMKVCKTVGIPFDGTVDILDGQYEILCDEPLSKLNKTHVKAYKVKDQKSPDRNLYAAICHPEHPPRISDLDKFKRIDIYSFTTPVAHGVVKVSAMDEYRYVFIFSVPQGKRLSELFREHQILKDEYFLTNILAPLAEIVEKLGVHNLCHGHIHPDNIWIGNNKLFLGESVTAPCGIHQEYIYEPPERVSAQLEGKGKGSNKTDVYALGVLGLESTFGLTKIREMSEKMFTDALLEHGAVYLMSMKRRIPNSISDYILGSLNSNLSERWNGDFLTNWMGGKRYNLVQMSSSTEASRPMEFANNSYYSARSLAHGFFGHWGAAKDFVRHATIGRWLEQNLNKKEQSTLLQRSIDTTGGTKASANKHNGELVARAILILDSSGPMRVDSVSFHISSTGYMIANALFSKNTEMMNAILNAINYDLPTLQADMNTTIYNENADILWILDKARQNLQKNSFGFGIERALYDMNPNLPCMSPLTEGYFISNNRELLLTLNHLALAKGPDDSLMDRHLAAFSASRSSMFKDIKFKALVKFPELANNAELHVIQILAHAQKTEKLKKLQGLAHWAASRAHRLINDIHGIKMREAMGQELQKAAEMGNLSQVLHYFINTPALRSDQEGFERACKLFASTSMKIHKMKSVEHLKTAANRKGTAIAAIASFAILVFSVYFAIQEHFL